MLQGGGVKATQPHLGYFVPHTRLSVLAGGESHVDVHPRPHGGGVQRGQPRVDQGGRGDAALPLGHGLLHEQGRHPRRQQDRPRPHQGRRYHE